MPPCSPSAVPIPALAWREVPGFLAGSAVTIVPSVRETLGNPALESLSAGTPVITHANGNPPALAAKISRPLRSLSLKSSCV
jgi:glycosyltransferase involved in cell wall biosynthesis